MSLADYFSMSPLQAAFENGDAVVLADGRTGHVMRRDVDLKPSIIAYHVLTPDGMIVARPETLRSYLSVRQSTPSSSPALCRGTINTEPSGQARVHGWPAQQAGHDG